MINSYKHASSVSNYVMKLIEYFKNNAELSGQEFYTSSKIVSELKENKVDYKIVGRYSIIVPFNSLEKDGIIFRVQLDGLPVNNVGKESDFGNNVVHINGHDVMISIILGVIKVINNLSEVYKGNIIFIFESGGYQYMDTKKIITSSILENSSYIYSLFPRLLLDVKEASINHNFSVLGTDIIKIKWFGESRSSSKVFRKKDAIEAAVEFASTIRLEITNTIDPSKIAITTITKIQGGTTSFLSSNFCELLLDIRYQDSKVKRQMHEVINSKIKLINNLYGVTSSNKIISSRKQFNNNKEASILAENSFLKIDNTFSLQDVGQPLITDTMYPYLEKFTGAVGIYGSKVNNNSSNYLSALDTYDVEVVKIGLAWHLQIIYDYIEKSRGCYSE